MYMIHSNLEGGKYMKFLKLKFEDEELHLEFKSKVAKNKTNMQEQIIKMIKEYLNESKKTVK